MILSLKALSGYTIATAEGTIGTVRDFLFNEEEWELRYADTDFGHLFKNKRLLIPRDFLTDIDGDKECFRSKVRDRDLEKCPEPAELLPISREFEQKLNRHYAIPDYWAYAYRPPVRKLNVTRTCEVPTKHVKIPSKVMKDADMDSSLRSFSEVIGYVVRARDGEIGKLADLLVDTADWTIVSAVVESNEKQFQRRKVIVARMFISAISYTDQDIAIDLEGDTILNSPEYNPNTPINEVLVKELRDYQGKTVGHSIDQPVHSQH